MVALEKRHEAWSDLRGHEDAFSLVVGSDVAAGEAVALKPTSEK